MRAQYTGSMTAHVKLEDDWRVLLPEELRGALGARPGELLEAALEGGTLVLRPKAAAGRCISYGGRLVLQTASPEQDDLDAAVDVLREGRLQNLLD